MPAGIRETVRAAANKFKPKVRRVDRLSLGDETVSVSRDLMASLMELHAVDKAGDQKLRARVSVDERYLVVSEERAVYAAFFGRTPTSEPADVLERPIFFKDNGELTFGVLRWDYPLAERPRSSRGPQIASSEPTVLGRLRPASVRRFLEHNQDQFRTCYERGLRAKPSLRGRVALRFVVSRDGGASDVTSDESDLPDVATVTCIAGVVSTLPFPQPEGGIATVKYAMVLSPRR